MKRCLWVLLRWSPIGVLVVVLKLGWSLLARVASWLPGTMVLLAASLTVIMSPTRFLGRSNWLEGILGTMRSRTGSIKRFLTESTWYGTLIVSPFWLGEHTTPTVKQLALRQAVQSWSTPNEMPLRSQQERAFGSVVATPTAHTLPVQTARGRFWVQASPR